MELIELRLRRGDGSACASLGVFGKVKDRRLGGSELGAVAVVSSAFGVRGDGAPAADRLLGESAGRCGESRPRDPTLLPAALVVVPPGGLALVVVGGGARDGMAARVISARTAES